MTRDFANSCCPRRLDSAAELCFRRMKLRAECSVEGFVDLKEPVQISLDTLEYHFLPNSEGHLDIVAIIAPIERPDRFVSSVRPPRDGSVATITFRMDDELIARVNAAFQALESHLAFRQPIKRLRWDSARYSLIFENESERASHGVHGVRVDRRNPVRRRSRVGRIELGKAVVATRRFAGLTLPLAFLREGQNDFLDFEYISAFYNFYFVLEGLYGCSRWRGADVQRAFSSSVNFQRAVTTPSRKLKQTTNECLG